MDALITFLRRALPLDQSRVCAVGRRLSESFSTRPNQCWSVSLSSNIMDFTIGAQKRIRHRISSPAFPHIDSHAYEVMGRSDEYSKELD
jgi:hypothetical protein